MHLMELEKQGKVGFEWTDPLTVLLQRAQQKNDENEFTLFVTGYEHHLKGEFEKALQYYNRSLAKNDHFAFAYNNRGVIHQANGDIKA